MDTADGSLTVRDGVTDGNWWCNGSSMARDGATAPRR